MVLSRLRTTDPWRWMLLLGVRPLLPVPSLVSPGPPRTWGVLLVCLLLSRGDMTPTCPVSSRASHLLYQCARDWPWTPCLGGWRVTPPPWRLPPWCLCQARFPRAHPGQGRVRLAGSLLPPLRLLRLPGTMDADPCSLPLCVSRVLWAVLWVSCGSRVSCFPCVPFPPGAVVCGGLS